MRGDSFQREIIEGEWRVKEEEEDQGKNYWTG